MARRGCSCGVCEAASQPAVCAACVNLRLAEKHKLLKRLVYEREILRKQLDEKLKSKREAEICQHWRFQHAERRTKLLDCLHKSERLLVQNKLKLEKRRVDYEARKRLLDAAAIQLHRRLREEQFPDMIRAQVLKLTSLVGELNQKRRQLFRHVNKVFPFSYPQGGSEKSQGSKERQLLRICGACLPFKDDPHSVGTEDYSSSLGYMVQLLNLVARYLSAPLLHNAAYAVSSSRIWLRSSYWDAHPTSRSEEYPLFLSRKSMKPDSGSGSAFFSLETPKLLLRGKSDPGQGESDRDAKQGLKTLKRSVSCICVYGYAMLGLPMPSNMSTFETLMELLSILASRESKPRLSGRVSAAASNNNAGDNSLLQSSFSVGPGQENEALRNEGKSRLGISDFFCVGADLKSFVSRNAENLPDEWDVVDHPILPPPSQAEDVEHWTRAMITDATK